jgi:hypothetical protein
MPLTCGLNRDSRSIFTGLAAAQGGGARDLVYRLHRGADGHYTGRTDFESSIDEAALKYAKQLANGRAVELWEGPRFIARLDGKPPTPDAR